MTSEENKALLVAQKGTVKGQITRFLKYLEDGGQDIPQLESRLVKLEQHIQKFEDIQGQLEILEPTNPTHISERESIENTYHHIVATAQRIISSSRILPESKQQVVPQLQRAKLPKIHLPVFDGKTEEWLAFRNIFISLIHSSVHLPNLDKLHYLRSSLKGQAAQVIQDLEFTDANYDVAWELINQRYHNIKVIARTHLRLLFDYPKLIKEDYKALRSMLDHFLKHTNAMQTLQYPVHSWDFLLVYILTSKLDTVTYRAWEIHSSDDQSPTFKNLSDFLQARCNMLVSIPHVDRHLGTRSRNTFTSGNFSGKAGSIVLLNLLGASTKQVSLGSFTAAVVSNRKNGLGKQCL